MMKLITTKGRLSGTQEVFDGVFSDASSMDMAFQLRRKQVMASTVFSTPSKMHNATL